MTSRSNGLLGPKDSAVAESFRSDLDERHVALLVGPVAVQAWSARCAHPASGPSLTSIPEHCAAPGRRLSAHAPARPCRASRAARAHAGLVVGAGRAAVARAALASAGLP